MNIDSMVQCCPAVVNKKKKNGGTNVAKAKRKECVGQPIAEDDKL